MSGPTPAQWAMSGEPLSAKIAEEVRHAVALSRQGPKPGRGLGELANYLTPLVDEDDALEASARSKGTAP